MKKYYMLGIGGVSMSALACFLKEKGFEVSGSDETQGFGTKILQDNGIEVDFSLNEEKMSNADILISSSAIKEDNPQYILARKLKKKIISRGRLLGEISNEYEKVIAVAGSHGKTTTTAMIFRILQVAGLFPTLHLGGYLIENGENFQFGGEEYFVTEACEYHDNFLNLHPYISVVTNVEKEHMDYFKTFSNQLKSFEQFKSQSKYVIDNLKDLQAKNIRHDKSGGLMFSMYQKDEKIMDLHLCICEEVNTQNCIYAYLVAKKLGIADCVIKQGLESFKGVKTRFEKMNCKYFDTVICDYAHHPTEIGKAIETAKKIFKDKKLITIFQPHTYSRTQTLLPQFLEVFKDLDCPIFYRTYSAREKPEEGCSSEEFTKILQKENQNAVYVDDYAALIETIFRFKDDNAVLLFLGAGDLPNILHKNKFLE